MSLSNNLARRGYLQSLELRVFGEDIIRQLSYGIALQRPVLLRGEMSDGTRKQSFEKDTVCLNSHVALPAIFACSLRPHFDVSYSLYKPGKKWHILSGSQVPPPTPHDCRLLPSQYLAESIGLGEMYRDRPCLPLISIKGVHVYLSHLQLQLTSTAVQCPRRYTHIKRAAKCFYWENRSSYSQVTLGDTIGTAGRLTSTHSNSVFVQPQLSG